MPSEIVYVNYWISPACYPRGSFCLISHGPSTRHRGITKPDFRLCAAHWPGSQAPLCLYTQRRVSIPPEGTFGRLRYLLGGDRPSQTSRLARSPAPFQGSGLGSKRHQGGISPAAPPTPKRQVLRLPPILRRRGSNTMPSSSKAPRGLFVLLRVGRIFTAISISPDPSLRQCSSCYTVRAGRNLPD